MSHYQIEDTFVLRAIHSAYVDAVDSLTPTIRTVMAREIGVTFPCFLSAVEAGRLRILPVPYDNGEPCVGVEVTVGVRNTKPDLLFRVAAVDVGLDTDSVGEALRDRIDEGIDQLEGLS